MIQSVPRSEMHNYVISLTLVHLKLWHASCTYIPQQSLLRQTSSHNQEARRGGKHTTRSKKQEA
jgi:hypothetical protein